LGQELSAACVCHWLDIVTLFGPLSVLNSLTFTETTFAPVIARSVLMDRRSWRPCCESANVLVCPGVTTVVVEDVVDEDVVVELLSVLVPTDVAELPAWTANGSMSARARTRTTRTIVPKTLVVRMTPRFC
jgi:hypothetical protein